MIRPLADPSPAYSCLSNFSVWLCIGLLTRSNSTPADSLRTGKRWASTKVACSTAPLLRLPLPSCPVPVPASYYPLAHCPEGSSSSSPCVTSIGSQRGIRLPASLVLDRSLPHVLVQRTRFVKHNNGQDYKASRNLFLCETSATHPPPEHRDSAIDPETASSAS